MSSLQKCGSCLQQDKRAFWDPFFLLKDEDETLDNLACQRENLDGEGLTEQVTSQPSKGVDMTFVATEDGLNPKEKHDTYKGKSLLRYSSEKLDLNKEIPEYQLMKKKAVGKVKYKGKIVVPPE